MADEIKMSDFTTKNTPLSETDYITVLVDDGVGGFTNGKILKSVLLGYKSYTALLTQSGTSAPTVTNEKSDFGVGAIVWSRVGVGNYRATSAGLFTALKTEVYISQENQSSTGFNMAYPLDPLVDGNFDPNLVAVQTKTTDLTTGQDSKLYYTAIEIRVYY